MATHKNDQKRSLKINHTEQILNYGTNLMNEDEESLNGE